MTLARASPSGSSNVSGERHLRNVCSSTLALFGDYKSNIALYPAFQAYFRTHQPKFRAVWGKNDPFFLPPGAEAFKKDMPRAVVRFFDTGHFALETHAPQIAAAMREFLGN